MIEIGIYSHLISTDTCVDQFILHFKNSLEIADVNCRVARDLLKFPCHRCFKLQL